MPISDILAQNSFCTTGTTVSECSHSSTSVTGSKNVKKI